MVQSERPHWGQYEEQLLLGAFDHVLEMAKSALASDERDPVAMQAKAIAEFSLNKKSDFLKTIDEAVGLEQTPELFLATKSVGLAAFGDFDEAREAAEEAVDRNEHESEAWLVLAQTCLGQGDNVEALEAAEKAVELEAEDPSTALKTLARAAGLNHKFEQALEAIDAYLQSEADDVQALVMRASSLVELNRMHEAISTVERAYELEPDGEMVLRVHGSVLTLIQEYEQAERIYWKWLDIEPSSSEAWTGLGLTFLLRAEWEQAVGALRKGVELDSDDVDAKTWLGISLVEVGESSEALTLLREATSIVPDDEEAWLGLASAERELGLNEAAIASAQSGLEATGFKGSEAWLELARCYSMDERHQNAWRAFGKAASLDRGSLDAALGIAVESIRCHNETRALREIADAEARLGPNALFEFNRGVALYKLGRHHSAHEAWRKARQLDPELGVADVLLGGMGQGAEPGSWTDHWFGVGSSGWRRFGGAALLLSLCFFLVSPFLEADLIPGIKTGTLSLEAFIPAILLALLLALPAIRGVAVGGVSVDVSPIGAPDQGPVIDPAQVLPVFTQEEIDLTLLIRR